MGQVYADLEEPVAPEGRLTDALLAYEEAGFPGSALETKVRQKVVRTVRHRVGEDDLISVRKAIHRRSSP